jgi:hypothetical protein
MKPLSGRMYKEHDHLLRTTNHIFLCLKLHNGNKSTSNYRSIPMEEQMNRGGLHNDIGVPLYGLDVGGKRKCDWRIDVAGENPLEFM